MTPSVKRSNVVAWKRNNDVVWRNNSALPWNKRWLVAVKWKRWQDNAPLRSNVAWKNNVVDASQFDGDVDSGKLPSIVFLVDQDLASEHPPFNICAGENWTVGLINAIMQGPDWNNVLVFVVWDDFGGFYDHEFVSRWTQRFGLGPLPDWASISLYFILAATAGMVRSCASALGEEIGWRGFLVPQLSKLTSFTSTALIE